MNKKIQDIIKQYEEIHFETYKELEEYRDSLSSEEIDKFENELQLVAGFISALKEVINE